MTPQDVLDLKVRNAAGEMVPFGSFTQVEWTSGAQQLQRYNGYPSMTISGNAAPGQSTGEAMAEMERLANALPEGFAYEWTGMSYEEQQAGGQVGMLLGLSILVVFLRSEEHTSELQSLMRISYAVFCLTKKNITLPHIHC